ncbi:hypothetical protein EMIHUDRAFT_368186 [Emiliania huxleyi CCMP1516]|uniref:Peptidyl-prolyl cis-trans isomerase n=2 Tax=Emiliania huxleyi TaxID=2903 RepID=A0A0D3JIJ3_EMIH1|nr:hypothetical protein EMIHUDRAFT_368186 [Emiliania huxleyi CCMP1516]EOD23328.1 hypothetical protein EMIHUDRAFT_368186 [Emiliania huxleyi CCMP1516]|eukprot:XP_005775757.1 hypothetical protein EMIHUDRAFT_368186 [Emiliania huxleyi CCMP1516]
MLDLEAQKHVVDGKLRCWLDIDINDSRAAYQRAVNFVAAKNLAYSLTSNWLPELGGSELKRVKEQLYANDFEWSGRGRCAVKMPPQRIYVEVWPEVAPLAVENFVALLLGNRGKGQESGCEMTYKGCHFHRCIKGFVAQGGDFVKNNGSGGECVFPGKKQGFKDDAAGLKVKLGERGMLAMGNSGKNTNTSQFFFTFGDVSRLTGKHVGFGQRDVDAPLRESQRSPSQSVTALALS